MKRNKPIMPDLIYYCTKENNDCQKRNECERYLNSDSHTNKTTLFKSACTDSNNRILFIKAEQIDAPANNNTKESDLTEQTT